MVPASERTRQTRQGHAGAQNSQRSNSHWYHTTKDVVGNLQIRKPIGRNTLYLTVVHDTNAAIPVGKWIVMAVLVASKDVTGADTGIVRGKEFVIGNNTGPTGAGWGAVTFKFTGFPDEEQILEIYVVRRAKTPGGAFGATVAQQQVHVSNIHTEFV